MIISNITGLEVWLYSIRSWNTTSLYIVSSTNTFSHKYDALAVTETFCPEPCDVMLCKMSWWNLEKARSKVYGSWAAVSDSFTTSIATSTSTPSSSCNVPLVCGTGEFYTCVNSGCLLITLLFLNLILELFNGNYVDLKTILNFNWLIFIESPQFLWFLCCSWVSECTKYYIIELIIYDVERRGRSIAQKASICCLAGPAGCGKKTLMQAIAYDLGRSEKENRVIKNRQIDELVGI